MVVQLNPTMKEATFDIAVAGQIQAGGLELILEWREEFDGAASAGVIGGNVKVEDSQDVASHGTI